MFNCLVNRENKIITTSFIRNKQNLFLISTKNVYMNLHRSHKDYSSLALISSLATPLYSIFFILSTSWFYVTIL